MEPKEQRKVDEFIVFAMCAATQALGDAGWKPKSYEDQIVTGVLIGAGIGGAGGIADTGVVLKERGPRRVSPFFVPGRIINLASGYVSIEHGLKGPNHAVVTACSTGSHAIGDAGRLVALGDADVMVAGGTESPINRISMAGFAAARALSTGFNDTPDACVAALRQGPRRLRAWREGAGGVVLEEIRACQAARRQDLRRAVGYGLSGDAYHITAPAPDGDGAFRCMTAALKRAGISPAEIDYINAHGTSTPLGDEIELGAVQRLLGNAAGGSEHVLDQVVDRASPGCRRRGRGDLLDPCHSRSGRAADDQSRQSVGGDADRPGAAPGQEATISSRAVEFFRVRRDECLPGVSKSWGLGLAACHRGPRVRHIRQHVRGI